MPVYFLQVGGDAPNAPMKIGYATDVATRLVTLQSGHYRDYVVRRVIEGARSDELRIHRIFQHLRIWGEWFHFDPAMLGDLGARDLPIPAKPVRTLRGGPMPQACRDAIKAGLARSWASGSLRNTRGLQTPLATGSEAA